MEKVWGKYLDDKDFRVIVTEFNIAWDRTPWDERSQRLRDVWLRDFADTLSRLMGLMEQAPLPPVDYGFPFRGLRLEEVLDRVRVSLPHSSPGGLERARAIDEIETRLDTPGLNLVDALREYGELQKVLASTPQPLGITQLPAGSESDFVGEALLVINLSIEMSLPDGVTATLLTVLFDDDRPRDARHIKKLKRQAVAISKSQKVTT